jgi:hypothetical protein
LNIHTVTLPGQISAGRIHKIVTGIAISWFTSVKQIIIGTYNIIIVCHVLVRNLLFELCTLIHISEITRRILKRLYLYVKSVIID